MYSNGQNVALGTKHSRFLFQDALIPHDILLMLERMLTFTMTSSGEEMGFASFFPPNSVRLLNSHTFP